MNRETVGICPLPDRWTDECKNVRCYRFKTGVVYGLLDARIGDIFYVGSTVRRPGERYSEHMKALYSGNFREAWILAILADGSLPVLLSLGEFATECEHELQQIEHAIADDLHVQGHTAICDGIRVPPYFQRIRSAYPDEPILGSEIIWTLYERAIAEHLDRVNEQSRILRWLRDL